jgi:hypothetical protein
MDFAPCRLAAVGEREFEIGEREIGRCDQRREVAEHAGPVFPLRADITADEDGALRH